LFFLITSTSSPPPPTTSGFLFFFLFFFFFFFFYFLFVVKRKRKSIFLQLSLMSLATVSEAIILEDDDSIGGSGSGSIPGTISTWARIGPVIISCCLIILIAILRNYSTLFSAIVATMPINVALAFWIVYSGGDVEGKDEEAKRETLLGFSRNMLLFLPSTYVWLIFAYVFSARDWKLWAIMGISYIGWAGAMGILYAFGRLMRWT
jgi:hypothetical protein